MHILALLPLSTSMIKFLLLLTIFFSIASCLPETEQAISWLEGHREDDYDWGIDTSKSVAAIQLADNNWYTATKTDNLLTVKQMEINMILRLFRDEDSSVESGHLAWFVMALLSLCQNPRKFYGKDLIGLLEEKEPRNNFELSLQTLATCMGKGVIKRKHAKRVLKITRKPINGTFLQSIDTFSLALMALQCLTSFDTSTEDYVSSPAETLAEQQQPDGSFKSSVYSTALALQALSQYNDSYGFDRESAVSWLISQQRRDGSFLGYVDATTLALPVLVNKSLLDLQRHQCADSNTNNTDIELLEDVFSPSSDTITVSYTLWFGTDVFMSYTENITTQANTSFYNIMLVAAEQNPVYEFNSIIWPNGHYISQINNFRERPTREEGFEFWILLKLDSKPDPDNKPSNSDILPFGVDDFFPEDGDFVLFWFKNI